MGFDYAIVAGSAFQPRVLNYLRSIQPRHVIGYVDTTHPNASMIDLGLPVDEACGLHEVDAVFRLLTKLDIRGVPPGLEVYSQNDKATASCSQDDQPMRVGVHISSRKPNQRWPADRFVEFIRFLRNRYGAKVFLYWSPGSESNKLHPGDDEKANEILSKISDAAVTAMPTTTLRELIDKTFQSDMFVCSDGGAMHIASGLNKPILCFFGDSDADHWHPWGVPYELIQPKSRLVADISTSDAILGFETLLNRIHVKSANLR